MPILNLLAYPRHEWPDRLLDVMHTPAGAPGGALFDAIEADKQGRSGNAVEYHLRSSKRQLKSRETWRFGSSDNAAQHGVTNGAERPRAWVSSLH